MNILITGDLTSFASTLAKGLAKSKKKVVVAGEKAKGLRVDKKKIVLHPINPSDSLFRDALSSYNFEFVIFIATREEDMLAENKNIGQQLDGLRNALELSSKGGVRRFFYVSSTEVYGNILNSSEDAEPQPSSLNGHALYTGEQYCLLYHNEYELHTTIVRVPYIYGPNDFSGLLYTIVQECASGGKVSLPASHETLCSFLHVEDLVDLLKRAIDEEHGGDSQIINLSSSAPVTYSKLAELLNIYFPKVKFNFNSERQMFTRPAEAVIAKRLYDWLDLYDLNTELSDYIDTVTQEPVDRTSFFRLGIERISGYQDSLKWVELILGAGLVHYFSELTTVLIQFKYVDFRLLFVVIMGSLYGIQFGLFASLLVSVSILYSWYQLDLNWALLIYNVGNWFPFALYFLAGLVTGFNRDKADTSLQQEQKQSNLMYEKYVFLYGVFDEIRKLKDEFREQLIGHRDSLGKIYAITRELDASQEQAVFFKALGMIEEVMQNYSIAIYSLDREYARLEVNSFALNEKIAKSLKLTDFPELTQKINQGLIFQNTALLPGYPAYVAPVLNNSYPFNVPVALVVIWSVSFDQYSTYYLNLFKVMSGLIQDALLRASAFMDMNYEKMYIPSTKILTSGAFVDTLRVRADMKKSKITDYQLLKIVVDTEDLSSIYTKISEGIRSADIVGTLNDESCYVLLTQADQVAAHYIIERLAKLGVQSSIVDASEFVLNDEMYATIKEILSEHSI